MNRILCGDVRARLAELPDESVHCVVTSPPYWGLRQYGDVDGQIGLESSFNEHLEKLVQVFRDVRRVLRPDGTCWLNLGDCYYSGNKSGYHRGRTVSDGSLQATNLASDFADAPHRRPQAGVKPKDLMMMPARIALALQADGWWVRSEIIYAKLNPMPESASDRPTSAHEKIYLLTQSGDPIFWTHRDRASTRTKPLPDYRYVHRDSGEEFPEIPNGADRGEWRRINLWRGHDYFYDADAVRTPPSPGTVARFGGGPNPNFRGGTFGIDEKRFAHNFSGRRGHSRRHAGFGDEWDAMTKEEQQAGGANLRNVWSIATQPLREGASCGISHYASFPEALVEPCIRAGTSERGVCPECGAPWWRKINCQFLSQDDCSPERAVRDDVDASNGWAGFPRGTTNSTTVGWAPSCEHDGEPVPAVVLDPFMGSGTTALVALKLLRRYLGIELNPEYVAMAERRLRADVPLLLEAAKA